MAAREQTARRSQRQRKQRGIRGIRGWAEFNAERSVKRYGDELTIATRDKHQTTGGIVRPTLKNRTKKSTVIYHESYQATLSKPKETRFVSQRGNVKSGQSCGAVPIQTHQAQLAQAEVRV